VSERLARPRVAFQGAPGAFGEEAIARYWGGRADPVAVGTFADAVAAVRDGSTRYAVVPVWNSTIGRIAEAWGVLRGEAGQQLVVRAVGEITIPVRHYLLCRPGVRPEDIRVVMGHPAALAQCSRTLSVRGYRSLPAEDSAGAARALATAAEGEPLRVPGSTAVVDPRLTATLAPAAAASRYHLAVVACAVQDQSDNRTSFLVVDAHRSGSASRA
jgi:prephenate dehydratase